MRTEKLLFILLLAMVSIGCERSTRNESVPPSEKLVKLRLPGEASSKASAWMGQYFDNHALRGVTAVERSEHAIEYDWTNTSPFGLSEFPSTEYSVRWTSCLSVKNESTSIEFSLGSDDGSRLLLNGKKIIDAWQAQSFAELKKDLLVESGVHRLVVEYFQIAGDAAIQFTVKKKSSEKQGVVSLFRPVRGKRGEFICRSKRKA